MSWIKHGLSVGFHSILLWLDAIVYEFVARMYDLFVLLAKTNIFKDEFYRDFSQRIYSVLGVIMLFVLAYALLKALVDPEQLTKGDKGVAKIVPTFVTSLVICGLLPSIFDFAYNLQNFILEENTIGILVLGSNGVDSTTTLQNKFGTKLAYTSLHAFLNPDNNECNFGNYTCESIENAIAQSPSNFMLIGHMTDAIVDGKVTYRWGFSTAVGLFLIYVLASFCLDLAVRSVRLAVLQLMAPIPVLMRVMPTKNEVFKKWLQKTIACFTEVFIRVLIMYLAVYFISNFKINWASAAGFTGTIANLLVIMGILMFAKEFPKLLSDITGIDSGNIKLGIKDFMGKLATGGALGVGAVLGSTLLGGTRNATNAFKNGKSFKSGLASTAAGAFSAGARSLKSGFAAKNLSDARKASSDAIQGATKAREDRAFYQAAHGGTFTRAMIGHAMDAGNSFLSFVGLEANIDDLKRQQALLNDMGGKRKSMADAAEAEINKKITELKVSSNHAQKVEGRIFDNLANLDNMIEMVKNSGKYTGIDGKEITDESQVTEYIRKLQKARTDLKDQMVADMLNGDTLDGTGTKDVSRIAGPVQEAISAYHTSLKNNIGTITANLTEADLENPTIRTWKADVDSYLEKTKGKDINGVLNAIQDGIVDLGKVADESKKYIGKANSNVNIKINEFRQKEEAKKGNKS